MFEKIISIIANICTIFGMNLDAKKLAAKITKKRLVIGSVLILFIAGAFLAARSYLSKQSSITVTQILLNEYSLNMSPGDTSRLTATVLYSDNSADNTVIWVSGNESVASVGADGVITARQDGTTVITAQASKNNITMLAECIVKVMSPPGGYSISVRRTGVDSYAYIYVEPYDDNVTKVQIYAKSPSGEIFAPNKDADDLYHFYSETGIWTIYASVENEAGKYEAHKAEDFVTIEVTELSGMLDGIFP